MGNPVILYDGCCNLCNFSTRLILKADRKDQFEYRPIESPEAQKRLSEVENIPDTVILDYNNKLYFKSDAVLKISRLIGFPINLLAVFYVIPRAIRDYIYQLIAKYRYRIFGKKDYCNMQPKGKKKRPEFWSPMKKYKE